MRTTGEDAATRPRTATVADEHAGMRVDAFVARVLGAASTSAARRLVEGGFVSVNGRRARKGHRLAAGETVALQQDAPLEPAVVTPDEGLALTYLREEPDFVAVNKPSGVPSHPLRAGETGTAAGSIVARYPECGDAGDDPREGGLVHRLDVGTSGVLIAARGRDAWRRLRAALKGPGCEKVYLAEVAGVPPTSTVVTAPIGRPGRRAGRVTLGAGRGLLPARTEVTLVERRGATSLVEARLAAGRPHQVRAHLAHLGCPVLGDDVYGDDESRRVSEQRGADGLRLHAARVTFPHPRTGAPTVIEAPGPPWARAGHVR